MSYWEEFRRGEVVVITDDSGKPFMEIDAPDPSDPDRGIDNEAGARVALRLYRALGTWLQVYARYHPDAFLVARDET